MGTPNKKEMMEMDFYGVRSLPNGDDCGVDFSNDEEITVEPIDCDPFCCCSSALHSGRVK